MMICVTGRAQWPSDPAAGPSGRLLASLYLIRGLHLCCPEATVLPGWWP
jgi:hypothetical protein